MAWCWPDLSAEAAQDAWYALTTWMRRHLVARYPLAERALYPWWHQHTDAVDALTSLYATWWAAYQNPGAEATASAWWLHQWLPAGIKQISQALHTCTRKEHQPGPSRDEEITRLFGDSLTDAIATDVGTRETDAERAAASE